MTLFPSPRASRRRGLTKTAVAAALAGALVSAHAGETPPDTDELWKIIQKQQRQLERQQQQIQQLKQRLERTSEDVERTAQEAEQADQKAEATAQVVEETRDQVAEVSERAGEAAEDRFSLGGYGSVRFATNSLDAIEPTFTHRRFVLAGDAQVTDRLSTYLELELERFSEIELEKGLSSEPGTPLEVEQAVEGTSGSELAVEQAWARYAFNDALNFDIGALLVPLGRFNLRHDDNEWNIPRRPLVDRGAPVIPAKAAWPELGAGFSGQSEFGGGLLDYRLYVMNGATLDFELEQKIKAEDDGLLESVQEAEFGLSGGPFDQDLDGGKAVTGRLAFQPAPGHELAVSGYRGRYTPNLLRDASLTSLGIDGLHTLGGFEIEYEGVYTDFEDPSGVAGDFAALAINEAGEIESDSAVHEVEIALSESALADAKSGYWLELRRPFWPEAWSDSILAESFSNPQLVPTLRLEQVFYDEQLTGFEFEDGAVSEFDTRDSTLNRASLALAYRPVPEWVFSLTGEYTWTDEDSLNGLTNFLAAGPGEDDALSLMFGVAFGF